MGRSRIYVLVAKSNSLEACYIIQALAASPVTRFTATHVLTLNLAIQHLHDRKTDLVLLDWRLPDGRSPMQTCLTVLEHAGDAAVIILTESSDADLAVRAIEYGAQDCLFPSETRERLIRTSIFALERQKRQFYDSHLWSSQVHDLHPHWDSCRRELVVGKVVVKRFRQISQNQTTVLAALEEERWPDRIDDPLRQDADMDPKERLRATIRSLNHRQQQKLILFTADGTGLGICWQFLKGHRPFGSLD